MRRGGEEQAGMTQPPARRLGEAFFRPVNAGRANGQGELRIGGNQEDISEFA